MPMIYMDTLWCNFFLLKYFIVLIQKKSNLGNCFNNGSIRCFLRVDLDYPDELHGFHNDYPLTPEREWSSQK